LLAFVFDGGALSANQARGLHAVDPELAAIRFCPPNEAARLLRPSVWRRAQSALTALDRGGVRYLQEGHT
jgi:hypothetical protein